MNEKWVLVARMRYLSVVQEIALPATVEGRYLRFVVLSTHDRQDYASAAELGILPE